NLLSNALQAMPPKEGLAGKTVGKVVIRATEEKERVRFEVADDGRGMPTEVREMAGRMFFSTKPEGAGLGLAQCRRLVAAAKGELEIASAPGAGTRVRFALPRAG